MILLYLFNNKLIITSSPGLLNISRQAGSGVCLLRLGTKRRVNQNDHVLNWSQPETCTASPKNQLFTKLFFFALTTNFSHHMHSCLYIHCITILLTFCRSTEQSFFLNCCSLFLKDESSRFISRISFLFFI